MTAPPSVRLPLHAIARTGLRQFVGFDLAGQRYLFRIERIQEIVMPGAVTRIPEVEAYVEGVTNLRGAIIPVVSLRRLFGLEPAPVDADTRLVVVNVGGRTMGCLVDAVSQIVRLDAAQVKPAPDTVTAGGPGYLEGFARIGDDLLILLDTEQLLAPANLEAVHRLGRPEPPAVDHEPSVPATPTTDTR
jgi:purine-binding chemotaxis protein CheW